MFLFMNFIYLLAKSNNFDEFRNFILTYHTL